MSPLTPSSAPKRAAATGAGTAYGMAWFPATEWASATRRWPDLLDHAPAEHQADCRIIEARLKTLHWTAPGISQHVSPITVGELDALATNSGEDAGTGTVRSHLAAEVVRTGRAVAWPPKRNDRCWCGSGRKYKQCCGPTPASILGEETYG